MKYTCIQDKQKVLFKRLAKLKKYPTESEIKMKDILDKLGIRYIFQKAFIAGDYFCIVDFYIPKPHKICLEVDGKYHDDIKSKDKRRDSYLEDFRGFSVIRVPNDKVDLEYVSSILQNRWYK